MGTMRSLDLFAGAGGGILAGALLGWQCVAAVEINEYRRAVLAARQEEGILERFPIFADIKDFDGRAWAEKVDVVAGGFPCQGISTAGRGMGLADPRSGLWSEMLRVVEEVAPEYVFVENSPALVRRGLDVVLSGLAALGYDAAWVVLGARHVGAPHARDRLWVAAHTNKGDGASRLGIHAEHDRQGALQQEGDRGGASSEPWTSAPECIGDRVAHGVARGVDRLEAAGDGQVPLVAAVAWRVLMGIMARRGV